LKYALPGGRVAVTLTVAQDRKQAVLTVSDNGAGIAPDDVPHVFERFFRARRLTSRSGAPHARHAVADSEAGADENTNGTGLGLNICQAVATAHYGVITCDSIAGQGTTMTVRLPLEN
jgi:signal transduction histidine kinase